MMSTLILVGTACGFGFAFVTVIDDDLGRSRSGAAERAGFQKLAAAVCAGSIGAVMCIEASRLSRNGRDWHHLIDLCALAGSLVIDPDGVYDPRLTNDRRARPRIDQSQLKDLAQDLPAVWNASTTTKATKQRLIRILIEEVVIDVDHETNESVVTIHWVGGRHSQTRITRRKVARRQPDPRPNPLEVMRKLGGHWPDRKLAVTMNRMRCRTADWAGRPRWIDGRSSASGCATPMRA